MQAFLLFCSLFHLKLHDFNVLDANFSVNQVSLWFDANCRLRRWTCLCFFFSFFLCTELSSYCGVPPASPPPSALPAISSLSRKTSEKTYRIRAGDSLWGLWKKQYVPGKQRVPVYSRTTGSFLGGAPPLVTRESRFMV